MNKLRLRVGLNRLVVRSGFRQKGSVELVEVQCPRCFESFEIALTEFVSNEAIELDYDCEVCCCPMLVVVDQNGVRAQSLDDL